MKKTNSKSTKKVNRNLAIAQQILDIIKSDDLSSWEKGWDPARAGVCKNAITGKIYNNLNFIRLMVEKAKKHYNDNRWLTYKQAQKLGGTVKSGEKATEIAFWNQWDKKLKKPFNALDIAHLTRDEQIKYIQENVTRFLKSYWVFNVEQCEGLKLEPQQLPTEEEVKQTTNAVCEEILTKYNEIVPIIYDQYDEAYYVPEFDEIHVPEVKIFKSADQLYATVLHEISHSTGHESRLKRELKNSFGSEKYAKEELVAELSSFFLQVQAGIKIEGRPIQNTAAYLKGWLSATAEKDQSYEFVSAVSKATKSAEFIISNTIDRKETKVKVEEKTTSKKH